MTDLDVELPLPAVATDGDVGCQLMLWRLDGRLQLTVIVKAVFSIVAGREATHARAGEIASVDRGVGGHMVRSLEIATDRVVYRPRCDVTLVGTAHTESHDGAKATRSTVRLALSKGGRPIFEKLVYVEGDRGPDGEPQLFSRMPLVYERALRGASNENPVGTTNPNLIDACDPERPAGLGPIAPGWPARDGLLRGFDRRLLGAPFLALPSSTPWAFFQSAPPDQQTDPLTGGETLELEGIHPRLSRIDTTIPTTRPVARWFVRGPRGMSGVGSVPLTCDTLAIDGDKQTFCLVWRGRHDVGGDITVLARSTLVAAWAPAGKLIDFEGLAKSARAEPVKPTIVTDETTSDRTWTLDSEWRRKVQRMSPMPFDAPRTSGVNVPTTEGTPWAKAPLPTPPPVIADESTCVMEPETQRKT